MLIALAHLLNELLMTTLATKTISLLQKFFNFDALLLHFNVSESCAFIDISLKENCSKIIEALGFVRT